MLDALQAVEVGRLDTDLFVARAQGGYAPPRVSGAHAPTGDALGYRRDHCRNNQDFHSNHPHSKALVVAEVEHILHRRVLHRGR